MWRGISTLQGSKVVSGPVLSDRGHIPPNITCFESDISENTSSANPVIEKHSQVQAQNQFQRESDTAMEVVMGGTMAPAIFKPEKNLVF